MDKIKILWADDEIDLLKPHSIANASACDLFSIVPIITMYGNSIIDYPNNFMLYSYSKRTA